MRDPDALGLSPILSAAPDVLLLTNIDHDADAAALTALRDTLAVRGLDYPHLFTRRPNSGLITDIDLDGDGRTRGARDAMGYGRFAGDGGQAILSRYPISLMADHSDALWIDTPGSLIADTDPGRDIQRLASTAFWAVAVDAPDTPVTLLTIGATPPVFDGPEDRNGRRNHDEVLFWTHWMDDLPGHRVVIGYLNLDPDRGDGLRRAAQTLLADPRLQDPLPGQPTVTWDSTGPMRVSYILPDASLTVIDAGIMPPDDNAGPHALIWVDVD